MGGYDILFKIEVVHDYFRDPGRLRVRFEPDAPTGAWLARTGCIIRVRGNALEVCGAAGPRGARAALAANPAPVDLRFAVRALDAYFAQYTDGLPPTQAPPLTLCGRDARAQDEQRRWRMRPSSLMTPPWTEGRRPDLVLWVTLTEALAEERRRYVANLRSRAVHWKYILVGDWPGAEVVDLEKDLARKVTFDAAPGEVLADGREVRAFRSTSAIALAERPERHFELRSGGPGGRLLVKRLPAPAAANLARDAGGLVSEIFVPR